MNDEFAKLQRKKERMESYKKWHFLEWLPPKYRVIYFIGVFIFIFIYFKKQMG